MQIYVHRSYCFVRLFCTSASFVYLPNWQLDDSVINHIMQIYKNQTNTSVNASFVSISSKTTFVLFFTHPAIGQSFFNTFASMCYFALLPLFGTFLRHSFVSEPESSPIPPLHQARYKGNIFFCHILGSDIYYIETETVL